MLPQTHSKRTAANGHAAKYLTQEIRSLLDPFAAASPSNDLRETQSVSFETAPAKTAGDGNFVSL